MADEGSMLNTPPTFGWYFAGPGVQVAQEAGRPDGDGRAQPRQGREALRLHRSIGFYKSPVAKNARSWMNVPFTLAKPDLDKAFCAEAAKVGLVNLEGHRSVGGMRASIYNAMSIEGIDALVKFMKEFASEERLKSRNRFRTSAGNKVRARSPGKKVRQGDKPCDSRSRLSTTSASRASSACRASASKWPRRSTIPMRSWCARRTCTSCDARHPARRRPRRRRHQQHPGRGALEEGHPGVQRARRERERREGAGARRHVPRRAQHHARPGRSPSRRPATITPSTSRSRRARRISSASSCRAARSA